MIPAGIKAGSMAFNILRTLYKGKKMIRTGTKASSKFLASKNMGTSAKIAEGVGKKVTSGVRTTQKTHSGTMKAKKLAKKYPKSAAGITGAIGYDIFDDD